MTDAIPKDESTQTLPLDSVVDVGAQWIAMLISVQGSVQGKDAKRLLPSRTVHENLLGVIDPNSQSHVDLWWGVFTDCFDNLGSKRASKLAEDACRIRGGTLLWKAGRRGSAVCSLAVMEEIRKRQDWAGLDSEQREFFRYVRDDDSELHTKWSVFLAEVSEKNSPMEAYNMANSACRNVSPKASQLKVVTETERVKYAVAMLERGLQTNDEFFFRSGYEAYVKHSNPHDPDTPAKVVGLAETMSVYGRYLIFNHAYQNTPRYSQFSAVAGMELFPLAKKMMDQGIKEEKAHTFERGYAVYVDLCDPHNRNEWVMLKKRLASAIGVFQPEQVRDVVLGSLDIIP
ncbi:MAG: hypothetical protein AB7E52_08180, partial [Bdellovibrionales bacterium]